MTTLQITLPDELAQKVASAGLLSAEAMEVMLREQLRRRAGDALQSMWQSGPHEELTSEIEQEIVQKVRKVRAERPCAAALTRPRSSAASGLTIPIHHCACRRPGPRGSAVFGVSGKGQYGLEIGVNR